MNIYNRIEQLAIDVVNQIFDSFDENSADERCDCEQCRLDVTCYVLNRLQPKYIISERGFTHIESEYTSQETADLLALAKEGIDRVARVKRPHETHVADETYESHSGQWRNFPIITGLVLNGHTFEHVADITVELKIAGTLARMKNGRWRNPLFLPVQANGRFSFWPAPVPVDASAVPAILDFEVSIQSNSYGPLHHFFQLTLDTSNRDSSTPKDTYEVANLHLFTIE